VTDWVEEVDVVVVGGGVNGAGAARDLSLRGLRVALFERNDFGAGATGASSGMIHGGARYLTHEPAVTRLSCSDSGAIQRVAAHMIFRIPFIFPFKRGLAVEHLPPRLATHLMDGLLFAYDLYQPLKGGLPHQRLTPAEALALEPGLTPDIVGAVTWDEWGIDAARLCAVNALSAAEAGARVFNHCQVDGFLRDGDDSPIRGVRVTDRISGQQRSVRARAVLNAAGPWSELVAAAAGATVRLRPAKGVHLVLGGRVSNYAVSTVAIDGRTVFLEPWQDVTLIGTTDDDYYGDLDCVEVTFDEAAYLLQAVETVFPSIRDHRVIDTWAGIRPTLWTYGPYEDRLSREHRVFDHRAEGAEGLFSLAGGKLASYRAMAEDAADVLCEHLAQGGPCRTAVEPLPGSEGEVDVAKWAGELGVEEPLVRKLARRYGSRAEPLLRETRAREPTSGPALACRCEQVLEAEVRHAARQEWAQTLGDVMRRTRLGAGPCGGVGCAHRAAQVLALELGHDAAWAAREAERFLEQRFRSRRPALGTFQARAEAINASFLGLHGPHVPERRGGVGGKT
jgi:glycerol-3-phosphate dehydrogenase